MLLKLEPGTIYNCRYAFQIVAALASGCEAFLTNDVMFRRVTELRVLVLDHFNTNV